MILIEGGYMLRFIKTVFNWTLDGLGGCVKYSHIRLSRLKGGRNKEELVSILNKILDRT